MKSYKVPCSILLVFLLMLCPAALFGQDPDDGGAPPGPPVITSANTASGTVGVAFGYQITATNSPTSYNATGLPAGLSVSTSTGLISGTPTTSGPFTVGVSATNTFGTGTMNLALTISTSAPGNCGSGVPVPAPAAAVAFNILAFCDDFNSLSTIDVNTTGAPGFNWYTKLPFGGARTLPSDYSVSGSVLTVTSTGWTGNWALTTKDPVTGNGQSWRYGYFEARIHFDPTLGPSSRGWPSFWALSAYHTRYNNLDIWAELDFFEAYTGGFATYSGAFIGTVHDWRNSSTVHYQNSNNWIPSSVNWNQWHTIGCLWTTGKITWYLDGTPLMTQFYSATAPPNPLANGTITPTPAGVFNIIDTEALGQQVIVGSSPGWPMYVDWVRVWHK